MKEPPQPTGLMPALAPAGAERTWRPPARFIGESEQHTSDQCEPLLAASRRGEVRLEALVRGAYPGRPLGRGVLPGVCSVGFWDAPQAQGWGLDWHRNEGLEITYLESGRLDFGVGSESVELSPGALTITRPWQQHRVGQPHVGASRLHWLILDLAVRRPNQPWRWPAWLNLAPTDLARLTEILRHNEHPVWPGDREIRACWQRIGRAVQEDAGGSSHSRLRVQLSELLLLLLEMLVRNPPPLDPAFTSSARAVALFLRELRHDQRQRNHPWTVAEMAEHCGLGATHFVALCRQHTNRTPARYLLQCRLEAAVDQLKHQPTLAITDVAHACGFASGQYFATVFHREFGKTPSEVRAEKNGREEPAPAKV